MRIADDFKTGNILHVIVIHCAVLDPVASLCPS